MGHSGPAGPPAPPRTAGAVAARVSGSGRVACGRLRRSCRHAIAARGAVGVVPTPAASSTPSPSPLEASPVAAHPAPILPTLIVTATSRAASSAIISASSLPAHRLAPTSHRQFHQRWTTPLCVTFAIILPAGRPVLSAPRKDFSTQLAQLATYAYCAPSRVPATSQRPTAASRLYASTMFRIRLTPCHAEADPTGRGRSPANVQSHRLLSAILRTQLESSVRTEAKTRRQFSYSVPTAVTGKR